MNYQVIDQECSVYDKNGEPIHKTVILVDTEANIPQPKDEWQIGSICMISDTHIYKILSPERKWE